MISLWVTVALSLNIFHVICRLTQSGYIFQLVSIGKILIGRRKSAFAGSRSGAECVCHTTAGFMTVKSMQISRQMASSVLEIKSLRTLIVNLALLST